MNEAEGCTTLQVPVSAAGQQATVPLSLGLHQRDIASHLLRLGLEQGLFLSVCHLMLCRSDSQPIDTQSLGEVVQVELDRGSFRRVQPGRTGRALRSSLPSSLRKPAADRSSFAWHHSDATRTAMGSSEDFFGSGKVACEPSIAEHWVALPSDLQRDPRIETIWVSAPGA